MDVLKHNRWSSTGILLGAIALILGIFHFSMGPFTSPSQTLESVVAREVSAVKRGILTGLTGKESTAPVVRQRLNVDKVLDNVGIGLAVLALVCAFVGGMRKESRFGVSGALIFGGATLAFHMLVFSIGLVCGIILLLLIISWLAGVVIS
ncbi:hypothetical protein [Atlantibacter sp.]|uniref:hypothetical protein n=1 Tax=Atlantibacter sp. TaxID=1903473 RepID=UPI0028AA6CC0|nr:hypothetical protein [Atlantibacter sp.]